MQKQRHSRWRPTREQVMGGIGIAIALVALISFGYDSPWTGFGQSKVNEKVEPGKTLWDWLNLLIVPVVLALAGYLFTASQNQATREATEERARDEALQAYLDKMSALLIDGGLHEKADPYDETRITARARTLSVLRQLDGERKKNVLLFLREARLINRKARCVRGRLIYHARVVGLNGADLTGADLKQARLISTSLKEAVSLEGVILEDADLEGADLRKADMREAILRRANLREAILVGADLEGTDLRSANLNKANLCGVKLVWADLSRTNLMGADLTRADLTNTNLSAVEGLTKVELEAQVDSLEGAIMPGESDEGWHKKRREKYNGRLER